MARLISTLGVVILFVGMALTTAFLWWLGDWENHEWGLTLSLKIIWGVWLVVLTGLILTHVTLFGWSFRNYLRPNPAGPPLPRRPATAPWYKSGVASFTTTVFIVSLTGIFAVALVSMWILESVTGDAVFWLVFKILGISYWVLLVAAVVTRISIFGRHKYRPQPPPQVNSVANRPEQISEKKS